MSTMRLSIADEDEDDGQHASVTDEPGWTVTPYDNGSFRSCRHRDDDDDEDADAWSSRNAPAAKKLFPSIHGTQLFVQPYAVTNGV